MPSNRPINISGPDHLIAGLPALLGFYPENSIVVVCFNGHRASLGATMRLDLPEPGEVSYAAGLISHQLTVLDPVTVALVAVTGDDQRARTVIDAITDRMSPDIGLLTTARLDSGRYWDYLRPGPAAGRPCPPLEHTPLGAALVSSGHPLYESRDQLAAIYEPAELTSRLQTMQATITTLEEFNETRAERGTKAAVVTLTGLALHELDTLTTDSSTFNASGAGILATAAGIPRVRDHLMGQITRANAPAHAEAWRMVATHTDGVASVAPYTLAAYASWRCGNGAAALIAVEHARGVDPDYVPARVTETAIVAGMDPRTVDRG